MGGGHPDFLLLGWSQIENAPPALETREQLQRTSYQLIRLAPAPGGDDAAGEARRLQVRWHCVYMIRLPGDRSDLPI